MRQVTEPSQSLIRLELTLEQTQLVLIALYALDVNINSPGKPIEQTVQFAQKCFNIDTLPDTDSDKGIGVVVDVIYKPYYIAEIIARDLYAPVLNDDEFGETGEVIQLR